MAVLEPVLYACFGFACQCLGAILYICRGVLYVVRCFKPEWGLFWLLGIYMARRQESRHKRAKLRSDALAVLTDVRCPARV